MLNKEGFMNWGEVVGEEEEVEVEEREEEEGEEEKGEEEEGEEEEGEEEEREEEEQWIFEFPNPKVEINFLK